MEEKDREIWIGESGYYLGEDNIVYVTMVGEVDDNAAPEYRNAVMKIVNMIVGTAEVLVDSWHYLRE